MIAALILPAGILLAVLEYFWARWSLRALTFRGSPDKLLAQPGETVTWTAEVENRSKMPILFARLWQTFPGKLDIRAKKEWMDTHVTESFQLSHVEERMSLMPRQRCRRSLQFTIDKRGSYRLGQYRLSAGDLLGLSEESVSGEGQELVIMPERSRDLKMLQALGGFLGDVSVRRFILEDPILTIGFRDYTGREPMKAISWTRTAMTGSLQVKQFDHTAEQNVVVLLNVEGAGAGDLEECFRLTRSVCEELERKKIPYAFRTNGNLPGPVGKVFSLASGLGGSHLRTILYGLGKADDTCFQSWGYLVEQTAKHRKQNEAYIIITPELDLRGKAALRRLEQTAGSGICLLTGKAREDAA